MELRSGQAVIDTVRGFFVRGMVDGLAKAGKKSKTLECGRGAAVRMPPFPLRKLTLAVYLSLVAHAKGKDNQTRVSPATIARELTLGFTGAPLPKRGPNGLRTVYRELKRLEAYRLIRIDVRTRFYRGQGRGTVSVYTLLPVDEARWCPDPKPGKRAADQEVPAASGGDFVASEGCPAGSMGAASEAAPLDRRSIERTPLTPQEGSTAAPLGAPLALGRPIAEPVTSEDDRIPTPNPAQRAGSTTPAPRPAVERGRDSTAPPARTGQEPTRQKEHVPRHAGACSRVVAHLASSLYPDREVDVTHWRRRYVELRLAELKAEGRGELAEQLLRDAVDGALEQRGAVGLRSLGDPVRYVFRNAERVAQLAELARRARGRAARESAPAARAVPREHVSPGQFRQDLERLFSRRGG